MPLHAYIAGSPASVAALSEYLEQTFTSACDELADTYTSRRKSAAYVWDGPAGSAAADEMTALIRSADTLAKASRRMGMAIDGYANSLRKAQSHIAQARETAAAAGLPVTGRTIEGPPEPAAPAWVVEAVVEVLPEQEAAFQDWVDKVEAWDRCVEQVDRAFEILEEAGMILIKDLGLVTELTTELPDVLKGLVGPAIQFPSHIPLPRLATRLDQAAKQAGMLADLSPNRSAELYKHLFTQLEATAAGDKTRGVSKISELGGTAADVAMTSYNLISRTGKGQSLEQAIVAEGAGVTVAAVVIGGVKGSVKLGAKVGKGPPMVAAGVVVAGAVVGAYGAAQTSTTVDQWYKNRDLEKLVRNAYRENQRVKQSGADEIEERY